MACFLVASKSAHGVMYIASFHLFEPATYTCRHIVGFTCLAENVLSPEFLFFFYFDGPDKSPLLIMQANLVLCIEQ